MWKKVIALSLLFSTTFAVLPVRAEDVPQIPAIPSTENVDDPVAKSIIDRLLDFIRDAKAGVSVSPSRLVGIFRDLIAYLKTIRVQMRDQIASSECADRQCTKTKYSERH